jgi:hypothetical protein
MTTEHGDEEFRRIEAALANRGRPAPELTDEEKVTELKRRGIEPGAWVRDPRGSAALVVAVGQTIKPHSKDREKKRDFYVSLARQLPRDPKKTAIYQLRFEHALMLIIVKRAPR